MNKKVISSLAILLLGFSTTAYADDYFESNINLGAVNSSAYNFAFGDVKHNTISTPALGAEMCINNNQNGNRFTTLNKNLAPRGRSA